MCHDVSSSFRIRLLDFECQLEVMTRDVDGGMISIPTAIIYDRNNETIDREFVISKCASDKEMYVHGGGHDISGAYMNSTVRAHIQIRGWYNGDDLSAMDILWCITKVY